MLARMTPPTETRDRFLRERRPLPHKCSVPVGFGTSDLCGSEEFCCAPPPTETRGSAILRHNASILNRA